MPALSTVAIVGIPVLLGLASFIQPKVELLGLMRPTITDRKSVV